MNTYLRAFLEVLDEYTSNLREIVTLEALEDVCKVLLYVIFIFLPVIAAVGFWLYYPLGVEKLLVFIASLPVCYVWFRFWDKVLDRQYEIKQKETRK